MNPKLAKSLKAYEELMLKKRAIENELDAMKEELIPQLPDVPVETEIGVFSVKSRPKWIYSKATRELDKELKGAQEREKQDGTAVAEPGAPFLEYREKQ